mmetsp:Transcript_21570/g.27217  ORF Transcript_21570/g.27217 Transcript_21570/m.27217 type:complete len:104 (+) Transcript_21570:106-417(+)
MSSLRNVRRVSMDSQSKMVMETVSHDVEYKDKDLPANEGNPKDESSSSSSSTSSDAEQKDSEYWTDSLSEYSSQILELGKSWTCTIPAKYLRSFALEPTRKED